jgi:hypothetical protein
VRRGEILAYLGGVMDGDGYFKVVREFPSRRSKPYYRINVGLRQL